MFDPLAAPGCCTAGLAVAVYEASADTCLCAADLGPFLTCTSRLLRELYPRHAGTPEAARWAEVAAAASFFFAALPSPPEPAEAVATLRSLPAPLQRRRAEPIAPA